MQKVKITAFRVNLQNVLGASSSLFVFQDLTIDKRGRFCDSFLWERRKVRGRFRCQSEKRAMGTANGLFMSLKSAFLLQGEQFFAFQRLKAGIWSKFLFCSARRYAKSSF